VSKVGRSGGLNGPIVGVVEPTRLTYGHIGGSRGQTKAERFDDEAPLATSQKRVERKQRRRYCEHQFCTSP
jgi:predicted DNA-binding WGR domain protein